jgi:hypothetical protein
MNIALVILKDGVLLLGKRVGLQGDFKPMCRLQGGPQQFGLCFMDPLNQVKLVVTLPRLFVRERVQTVRFFGICLASDVLVEAIDSLPLILRGFVVMRVKAEGVVGATSFPLVGPIKESPGPSPSTI